MPHQDYAVGDIVNDHVLIGEAWVPVRHTERSEGSTYEPGDVVNGHVWTGTDWVATRAGKAPKKPGFSERLAIAREQLEQEQAEKERTSTYYEQCGRMVAEGIVAGRQVKIYEKGYVRVGMLKAGQPEKLLGISASDNSQQKTGLGRAVVAGATLGANILLSPSKRGSFYLVIVTDKKTHNLNMSPPTDSDLKAMHKLEGAGRAVLAALEAQRQVASTQIESASIPSGPSLAEQLTQLTELHKAGALSDDEFAAAKAQLLSEGGA